MPSSRARSSSRCRYSCVPHQGENGTSPRSLLGIWSWAQKARKASGILHRPLDGGVGEGSFDIEKLAPCDPHWSNRRLGRLMNFLKLLKLFNDRLQRLRQR